MGSPPRRTLSVAVCETRLVGTPWYLTTTPHGRSRLAPGAGVFCDTLKDHHPDEVNAVPSDPMRSDPPLAYYDRAFLESDDGRPLRILAEYLDPLQRFRRERVHDTVVFFGSARLRQDGPLGRYYDEARELARQLTEWARALPCDADRFLVCTGGGGAIMEAANRGAADAGGRTIGLNIGLPHEQRPNPYITPALQLEFHYFFMRKLWFAYLARAMVAFPGGFGTLDEVFELLTLAQTKKLDRPLPVLLYGRSYWEEIVDFEALARHGMISPRDLALFRYVDTPAEAMAVLKEALSAEMRGTTPDIARTNRPGCGGEP